MTMRLSSALAWRYLKIRLLGRLGWFPALVLIAISAFGHQLVAQAIAGGENPAPRPAIPAIVSAFNEFEIVGMSEGHGLKDADDLILDLIRTPALIEKINDIAVECGNSLYQPILDRYIAGEEVPFAEVRKVWRNTTQLMCGTSGFFEQMFPVVRAINQKLPPEKRIRVLACDPPVDWGQIETTGEIGSATQDRNQSIASVMEKEVLSKHRRALMLIGVFHLMHERTFGSDSAVEIFEKHYPKSAFIIESLEGLNLEPSQLLSSPFSNWPIPSLAQAKRTWLGALKLSRFQPPPVILRNCVAKNEFPEGEDKPMENLVDAFLYLGAPGLALREQMAADIALDSDFMTELNRQAKLLGLPPVMDSGADIVKDAEYPFLDMPKPPGSEELRSMEKGCRDRMRSISKPQ